MARLLLPDASDDYYLFNLKVDHISMLKKVGYMIPEDEKEYSDEHPDQIDDRKNRFAIFTQKYRNKEGVVPRAALDNTYKNLSPSILNVKVSFTYKQVVKGLRNQEYREAMEHPEKETDHITIQITKDKPPDDAKTKPYDKARIIYYLDRQITFDVTDHAFSTKLVKRLSMAEREKFYGQSGMSGKSLKGILVTDPIAINNGWRIDDVVRLYRENVVVGQPRAHISYAVITRQPPPKQKSSNDVLDPTEST
ncbi:Hypothetical protein POVR1_LOCUS509 [uncultured virus]|nr:Hypothetical protein POVR1_LOCUS509 [uncultured virus]